MNNIGEFIEKLRKEKNITQRQLGKSIGVSDKVISKWERGVYLPDIPMLGYLSKALGITVDELVNCELKETNENDTTNEEIAKTKLTKKTKITMTILIIIIVFISGIMGLSIKAYLKQKEQNSHQVNVYSLDTNNDEVWIKGYVIENGTNYMTIINDFTFQNEDIGTKEYNQRLQSNVAIKIYDDEKVLYNFQDLYANIISANARSKDNFSNVYKNSFDGAINSDNLLLEVNIRQVNGTEDVRSYSVILEKVTL